MPEDYKSKTVTLASLTGWAAVTHNLNPSSQTNLHRNQAVVVHAFNPKTRQDYKTGGDSSQSQSHSEIPGNRFAVYGLT